MLTGVNGPTRPLHQVPPRERGEALDKEINAKLELLKAHPLIGTPASDAGRWWRQPTNSR